jgi:hypothetical protein
LNAAVVVPSQLTVAQTILAVLDTQKISSGTLRSKMTDMVNHPPHYTSDPSGVEAITVLRHRNYNIGNAMKYLWRAGIKNEDTHIQDLEKAIFYIKDEIKRIQNQ